VDSVLDGEANGDIQGAEILIAKDAEDPVGSVLGHEITHRLQDVVPEEYRAFQETAALDEAVMADMDRKLELYRERGVELDYEGALDEATADYAGRLMRDGELLDRFIDRNRGKRTLLERIRDAFRTLADKFTGAWKRRAQTAEGRFNAALDAAARQVRALEGQTSAAQEGSGERFSIKVVGGKNVVWIENSPFTNKELRAYPKIRISVI